MLRCAVRLSPSRARRSPQSRRGGVIPRSTRFRGSADKSAPKNEYWSVADGTPRGSEWSSPPPGALCTHPLSRRQSRSGSLLGPETTWNQVVSAIRPTHRAHSELTTEGQVMTISAEVRPYSAGGPLLPELHTGPVTGLCGHVLAFRCRGCGVCTGCPGRVCRCGAAEND